MTTRTSIRAITLAALSTATAVTLVACSGGGQGGGTGRSATSTPSATATPIGTPVTQTCDQLVPAATFDVYGKQFTLDADAEPEKGSPAAKIAQERGRVCAWHQTDDPSVTVTLAVAHLPEKSLTNLKDALYQKGGSVPTYTVEGYFSLTDGVGRADAFPDPYWITTTSTLFTEPGTAQPVVDQARSVLTAG